MSILGRKWEVASAQVKEQNLDFITHILARRGVTTQQGIKKFLEPDYTQETHDPFLLKGIQQAVEVIEQEIRNKSHFLIYGDYDADGVCASVILQDTLNALGAEKVSVYIPHRQEEGYGMNKQALDSAFKKGVDVVITVDCGSTNFNEARHCKDLGMKLIITDHHTVLDELPQCDAFINPHQPNDKYPFKDIAGTTVAFKLACALLAHYRETRKDKTTLPIQGWEKWFLDLVALATITDVMPVVGENRALVQYGLLVLSKTKRVGLQALMTISNIPANAQPTSFMLGFLLGPRINAAGRMSHANIAFNLLNAKTKQDAYALARKLDALNAERKKVVEDILEEIQQDHTQHQEAIVLGSEKWPVGVLGIVAGRLCDTYQKPAFIYQKQHSNIVGSARTPQDFNTVQILEQCSDLLKKFGGHSQAGGFTASCNNEKDFQQKVITTAKKITPPQFVPVLRIDYELSNSNALRELSPRVQQLEPFGAGNEQPVFVMRDVMIQNQELVGRKSAHLKLYIECNNTTHTAIGFGLAFCSDKLSVGEKIDIAFCLRIGDDNTHTLELIDIQKHNES